MTEITEAVRIASLLADRGADGIRRELADWHPYDIAEALGEFEPPLAEAVLVALPLKRQAQVFGYLGAEDQLALARRFRRAELGHILAAMDPDERADLYKRLPEEERAAILPGLAQAEREDIRKLASYPEDRVGSVMTSGYVTIPPELTAAEAFAHLRRAAPDRETIHDVYVIDEQRRVVGVVGLRDLLVAPDGARIDSVMNRDVLTVSADAPRAEAVRMIEQYDLIALPVINGGDKLVGVVTADDAFDVIEERTTDAFQRQAALSMPRVAGGVGVLNVLEATLVRLWRVRIVWLVLLVFGNILSGFGIAAFEEMIAAHVALVFFLPLLIASGGNAGSQASTLMVRALATGDVGARDYARLIGREVVVATMLGVTMAAAVSLIGLVRAGPEIALVVALAMVAIVLAGSLIGMSLPFVLSRFGGDPATSSAPLVTSIADVIGVLAYLGIAAALLA